MKKYSLNMLLVVFAIGLLFAAHFSIIDGYIQIVIMTIGINPNLTSFYASPTGARCIAVRLSSIFPI